MPMSPTALATLRRYIAEQTEAVYTDVMLNGIFDSVGGDVNVAAAEIWREKAARASALVDTSEGASSRKMSQVYAQAVKQADFYNTAALPAIPTRGAKTRAIER